MVNLYEIVYYRTPRGEEVIRDFLHSLDKKTQAKIYARLTLLSEQGPNLKRPYADIVEDKIRELRVVFGGTQARILYFFFHKDQIVLLHGYIKKTWAISQREIEIARRRIADWTTRIE